MPRQSLSRLPWFVLLLVACAVATPTQTVSVVPPTAVVQPLPSASQPASSQPTLTPVDTPTALPLPQISNETILILAPGPNSPVTSPVTVSGISDPTFENNLALQVLDENGNIIGAGYALIEAEIGQRGPFVGTVEFTPPAQPQVGRLVVLDASARDGHTRHLASAPVRLLPAGAASAIKPAPESAEMIEIQSPTLGTVVSGGLVSVSGFAAPVFEQTLNVAVLDAEGAVVGSGVVHLQSEVGQPGPFTGEITYSVISEQPGSVQVYASSPRDGGLLHLTSVEVTLQP